jgi:hypothetical protein
MDRKLATTVPAQLLIERSPVSRREHIPMRFDGVHSQLSGCYRPVLGATRRSQGIDSVNP